MNTFINQFSVYPLITRKIHAALDLNLQGGVVSVFYQLSLYFRAEYSMKLLEFIQHLHFLMWIKIQELSELSVISRKTNPQLEPMW